MKNLILIILPAIFFLAIPSQTHAQGLEAIPSDLGRFSVGLGLYQAPDDAVSDSGVYSLIRYEISTFEFEIDYGIGDQAFFLGAADYLYFFPTAPGITQTEVALGAGLTFVNNDPAMDGSEMGFNALVQIRFMESFAAQVRRDFLGGDADLWTFGLTWTFY